MSTTMSPFVPKKPDLALFKKYRLKFWQLYLGQNKSLEDVQREMERDQGFPKTEAYQYGLRYLGFIKKLSIEEWVVVESLAMTRKRNEGKDTIVFLSGILKEWKEIERNISRHKPKVQMRALIRRKPTVNPPQWVSLMTPPPPPKMAAADAQSPVVQAPHTSRGVPNIITEARRICHSILWPDGAPGQTGSNPNSTASWLSEVPSAHILIVLRKILTNNQRALEDTITYGEAYTFLQELDYPKRPFLRALGEVCAIIANSLDMEITECREILTHLGIKANKSLLEAFFALKIPALATAWINLVALSTKFQSGDAFQALVDVGFEIHNGEWIQQHAKTLIELTVPLGSKMVGKTALRLLSSTYFRNVINTVPDDVLYDVARNLDAEMLSNFVDAGVKLQGNRITTCLIWQKHREIAHKTARNIRLPANQIQRINLLRMAGFDFDCYVRSDSSVGTVCLEAGLDHRGIGWRCPFSVLDDLWVSGECGLYETMAHLSEREKTQVTIPGLIMAARKGAKELRGYILLKRMPPLILVEAALSVASGLDDITAIESLHEIGVDPNVRTLLSTISIERHWHPLMRAAAAKCFDAVRTLVAKIGDNAIPKTKFFNPLSAAVSKRPFLKFERIDQLNIVRHFLDKDRAHIYGTKAMIAEAMIEASIPPQRDYVGRRPQNDFVPDKEIIDMLRKAGASLDQATAGGKDLLHLAIDRGCNLETVEFFLAIGAQVHFRPADDGKTMLHSAAASQSTYRQETFIEPQVDGDQAPVDILGLAHTPLQLAIRRGRLGVAHQLLIKGADINAPAALFGYTTLQAACAPDAGVEIPVNFIRFLLHKGAKVNAPGPYPHHATALHYAIIKGSIATFCLLLGSGANIHATYRNSIVSSSRSALDLAAQFGRLDMVDILLKKGARSHDQSRGLYAGAIELTNQHGKFAIAKMMEGIDGRHYWIRARTRENIQRAESWGILHTI
ncbi:hypothetical protein EKO27_g10639 [Xylaria grammica]|uniref:Clr5 domain-containing protein n=1 Tax=Xylaria grammica TaxID=363999 RepID=A0A439CQM5_9PEZI|nr:hypothetical protein EKO27_g10639 [Xylaria grammica]